MTTPEQIRKLVSGPRLWQFYHTLDLATTCARFLANYHRHPSYVWHVSGVGYVVESLEPWYQTPYYPRWTPVHYLNPEDPQPKTGGLPRRYAAWPRYGQNN